jgi:ribose transport system substrate-binding protein
MNKLVWILAAVFGLAFLGATLLNAELIGKSRQALGSSVLKEKWPADPLRYQVVVIIPDTDDSFFQGLLKGIAEGAPKADAAVQVFRYPAADPSQAEAFFEIALRAKVDGLIMFTPHNDRIADRAEKLAGNGVVFIPVGTDAPPGSPPSFIGSGSLRQGLEGGKRICAALGAAARIGVILPATGAGSERDEPIYRGVAAALKAFPGAAILDVKRARPGVLSGEETASTMLHNYPAINALFCSSSRDTVGAAQVVVDTNKVGRVLIIGSDETPEIHRYLEKGVISASIVRDSRWIGQEAMRSFARLRDNRAEAKPIEAGFFISSPKEPAP